MASIINNINQPVSSIRGPLLLQKAQELCAEVKGLGGALLQAIEKGNFIREPGSAAYAPGALAVLLLFLGLTAPLAGLDEGGPQRHGADRVPGRAAVRPLGPRGAPARA